MKNSLQKYTNNVIVTLLVIVVIIILYTHFTVSPESQSCQKPSSYKWSYKDVWISKSEFTQKSTNTAQDAEFGKDEKNIIIIEKRILHATFIKKERKTEEDTEVLRWVLAFLNLKENQRGKLILQSKDGKIKPKDFDTWCQGMESKIKMAIDCKHIIDFIGIELIEDCHSVDRIVLSVTPTPNLTTHGYYLYYPSVSSVDQVQYAKAVELLSQEGPSEPLPTIENRTYKLNHVVEGLRTENECTQFKQITGKNIPNTAANMCSRYISAFGNYKGGVIYYGFKDETGEVVGVNISNLDNAEELIERAVNHKIGGMFYGKLSQKLIRKKHWDIQFYDVEDDTKENTIMQSKKIIAISVCKIPGGVFTAVPESYYVDNEETLQNYKVDEWAARLLKSDKGMFPPKVDPTVGTKEMKTTVNFTFIEDNRKVNDVPDVSEDRNFYLYPGDSCQPVINCIVSMIT